MAVAAGNRTLAQILGYRARATPDRAFLLFDDLEGGVRRLSYREMDVAANRAANVLLGLGLKSGDRINLHLANCPEFYFLWFGAAKAGVIVMPTNTAASVDELTYLLAHSGSRLIFTQPAHADAANAARRRCPGVEDTIVCAGGQDQGLSALMANASASAPDARPKSSDAVGILYTSGTTAKPKGVVITNANYIYAGETVAKAIRLGPDDRHLVVLPLFHGNAQYYSTMSAMVTGASLVLTPRFSASRYLDLAIAHGCTVGSLFAAPMRMILAQPRNEAHRKNRLRVVIFAQSVTPAQLDEWHERFRAPLLQLWGMTETMGPPLMNPLDYERNNMSCGLPAMGYEVSLADSDGQAVKQGEMGQIIVRGEPGVTLMKEYYRNPEATAETIRNGWLWSGDNAYQDADGYFHFVDRAKDMIKRAGENVAASEVESVVLQHPDVFDCAVVGVPDPVRDESIVAVVTLKRGARQDAEAIIDWCRQRLAKFRVPERVEFRDALPRTSVGKIQKHLLRRELASGDGKASHE